MNLTAQIEAILFIEAKPLALQRLATILKVEFEVVQQHIVELQSHYETQQRGLRILTTNSKVQLVTAPELHEVVAAVIKDERTGELSKPSLETLAIIAYRSPVTKAELEMIRGINCTLILRNLLIRGLIEERFDKAKGVEIYDITPQYLQLLGVSTVQQLPEYERLHQDIKIGEVLAQSSPSGDFFAELKQPNDETKTE